MQPSTPKSLPTPTLQFPSMSVTRHTGWVTVLRPPLSWPVVAPHLQCQTDSLLQLPRLGLTDSAEPAHAAGQRWQPMKDDRATEVFYGIRQPAFFTRLYALHFFFFTCNLLVAHRC